MITERTARRRHYVPPGIFSEVIIAVGSHRPVKEFARLKFTASGNIYWFDEPLEGYSPSAPTTRTDRDYHMSFHVSGETHLKTHNKRINLRPRLGVPLRVWPAIETWSCGTTVFAEDFFYEGLPTVGPDKKGEWTVPCLYEKVIGSALRCSVDLVNRSEENVMEQAIMNRFALIGPTSYALSFAHQGRTVVMCLEFSGGEKGVDEGQLRARDPKQLHNIKVDL